jgi:hypothetical protein
MLMQATRSTTSTLPNTNQRSRDTGPTMDSRSDCTCGVMRASRQVADASAGT